MLRLASLFVTLSLGACTAASPRCGPAEQTVIVDTLYFGTQIPSGGSVSDTEWQAFVDEIITPRFPQGLTQWMAQGQWRERSGAIEREASHVLQVAHADSSQQDRQLDEIRTAYRERFKQEAVLKLRSRACMAF